MRERPRLYAFDLIITDCDCAFAAVIGLGPWLFVLMDVCLLLTRGRPSTVEGAWMAYVATAAGTAFAVFYIGRRLRIYRAILANPVALWGQVTSLHGHRGRLQVSYAYECSGQVYRGRCSVFLLWRGSKPLRQGGPVALLVDRDNPGHSLLPDLYL